MKRFVLGAGLCLTLLLSSCVAQQQQLEDTRAMLKEAQLQELALSQQIQDQELSAIERNSLQTSLDRTRALVKKLEAQEAALADQVERGLQDWATVGTNVLMGVLGLGALGGRRQ